MFTGDDRSCSRSTGRSSLLAGHSGTGDAGFFTQEDGSAVLRLENLDIQNGPALQLYVVPGADRTAPSASISLSAD